MSRNEAVRKAVVPSDIYRNSVLEDISIAAFQADAGTDFPNQEGGFIARAWFPTIPEPEQAFRYYEIDMDSISQNKAQPRAPGAVAEEGTWDASLKSGLIEQFGYREKVPEEIQANMGESEEISTLSVAEVLAISDEVRVAAAAWKTGVWARDVTGVSGTPTGAQVKQWNDSAATPINDILAERVKGKLVGKRRYNTMILGADVVVPLLTSPQIIARVVNGQRPGMSAEASLDDLAKLFKVDRVLVADAVMNSAKEGATASNGYILNSKSAWIGYVNPNPGKRATSAGYRFTWAGIAGNKEGLRNWKYWDQPSRSTYVEGAVDDTFKIINAKNGTFFTTVVA